MGGVMMVYLGERDGNASLAAYVLPAAMPVL
jgi:hypothetical protein